MKLFATTFLLISYIVSGTKAQGAQGTQVGPCHPYPGAVVQDCLQLLKDNINNFTTVLPSKDRIVISYQTCSIVTKLPSNRAPDAETIDPDYMARKALLALGTCAELDRGSVSEYATAADGTKTCLLYIGRENSC
ncbi:hypothetical protein BBP40_004332 [Aspergillus hancockii]|nr:hypothetical protein BBP40_004332 [Aspergillus hancockii]